MADEAKQKSEETKEQSKETKGKTEQGTAIEETGPEVNDEKAPADPQSAPATAPKAFSSKEEAVKKIDSYLGLGVNQVHKLTVFAGTSESRGGDTYNVIDFTFTNDKGAKHTHRIFDFSNADTEEKMHKSAMKAMMESKYIIEKALNLKDLVIEFSSFEELQKIVVGYIKAGLLLSNHQIKITANQNNKGKWNPGFVTYSVSEKNKEWGFGWFHNLNVEPTITLSKTELENIRKMTATMSAPTTGATYVPSGDGSTGAPHAPDDLPF